jgi:hypothetical protein
MAAQHGCRCVVRAAHHIVEGKVQPMQPTRSNLSSDSDSGMAHADGMAAIAPERAADAIRYAVLGIVAAGLRHAIVGELQAIQGSAEVAATMLDRGGDRAVVGKNLARIPRLCKSTGKKLGTLVEWLRPAVPLAGPARDCIKQCVDLVSDDWALRGIEVTVDTGTGADADIDWTAMRELVVTALLILADFSDQPVDISVALRAGEGYTDVSLQARIASRVASLPPNPRVRQLSWGDLKHLAALRGVPCVCEHAAALLRFPPARA